jgi:hypothetical protein
MDSHSKLTIAFRTFTVSACPSTIDRVRDLFTLICWEEHNQFLVSSFIVQVLFFFQLVPSLFNPLATCTCVNLNRIWITFFHLAACTLQWHLLPSKCKLIYIYVWTMNMFVRILFCASISWGMRIDHYVWHVELTLNISESLSLSLFHFYSVWDLRCVCARFHHSIHSLGLLFSTPPSFSVLCNLSLEFLRVYKRLFFVLGLFSERRSLLTFKQPVTLNLNLSTSI